jgi:hypothetical protein
MLWNPMCGHASVEQGDGGFVVSYEKWDGRMWK